MKLVSVIIPVYNEEKNIGLLMEQLQRQSLPRDKFEIIVVDGGSMDRTIEIAERYADKVIRQQSRGVGGARNDGVAAASCDLIATTDADVKMLENWLEMIIEHFKDENVVGVCGPNFSIENKLRAHLLFSFAYLVHMVSGWVNVVGMPGNNTAFKKTPFLEIGGYDENAQYLDDIEMGMRLRGKGKIVFDKELIMRISMRRMEEEGYLNVFLLWARGDLWLLSGRKLRKTKKQYFRKEYT